jgi:hypothetical protein
VTGFIALAVYRPRPELLRAQVQSLKGQTLTDWVCHIGIDGIDPTAAAMCRSLVRGDARFSVTEYPERRGFYRNFERILGQAPSKASWVALCDQDDRWRPEKLETLVPELRHAALVQGSALVRHEDGRCTPLQRRTPGSLGELVIENTVTGSFAVFRRDVLLSALPFPPDGEVAYHDHWLAMVAMAVGGVAVDSRVLQEYVQHDANVIGENRQGGVAVRLRRLLLASGAPSPRAAVRHLAVERWGWRARAARELLARSEHFPAAVSRDLALFARGRFTFRLARIAVSAAVRGHAPWARVTALLIGSACAYLFSEDRTHGSK